ncbi:hypothetical protein [Natronolimnobius baerhuensis]|uniref:Uncharacterized protein n=1 Tax=Natronolimnobius baerhuensis TaxID=253108 RepID=A0A202EAQ7_9EURY|nr:hypothetical protein [Natronolimnobius baerhuensis]OVE85319.1 hypothetical protein B2G88_00370 [Natronolimnobius baerhuensis]
MGARTDAALSVFVLVAVALGFVLTNATFSTLAFALGGLATLAFEAVATRNADAVRAYWERRPVQAVAVALALVGVVVGASVAPSSVLSAMAGALVTYLGFLAIVTATRRSRA